MRERRGIGEVNSLLCPPYSWTLYNGSGRGKNVKEKGVHVKNRLLFPSYSWASYCGKGQRNNQGAKGNTIGATCSYRMRD